LSRALRSVPRHRLVTAEINPLVVTGAGSLALDAKMNFDDNALYKHPDIKDLRDLAEEDPLEIEASKFAQLHSSRRQHRLHGQRRRPGDGDDGHHRRRRRASLSSTSVAAPATANASRSDVGQEREGGPLTSSAASWLRRPRAGRIAAVGARRAAPIVIRMEGTNVDEGKRLLKRAHELLRPTDGEAATTVVSSLTNHVRIHRQIDAFDRSG
jgi:succinyl-CoA synthetase beta subunit